MGTTSNKELHFTYNLVKEDDNLRQGDILKKTDRINSILEKVHKYYQKEDYTHFIVLTQSCDLVIRDEKGCNSRYITLAPIRPLKVALLREIGKYQDSLSKAGGVCTIKVKPRIEQFLERLLNNNEPEYFYLHEEPSLGFPNRSCAFLQLAISIKSEEHYNACVASRILSLEDVFQAKLGWLVGNIYSRVGTKDWAPDFKSNSEFKKMINDILDKKIVWLDSGKIKELKKYIKKKDIEEDELQQPDILKMAEEIHLPTEKEKKRYVLESIKNILESSNVLKDGINIERVLLRIESDPVFSGHIR